MTEIGFYHLTRSALESALPRLLERVLAAGKRAVVRAGSAERVEFLNSALWTYDPASFLPHGGPREGNAPDQPIWLTADQDNPNGAQVLVLTDGVAPDGLDAYERCVEMFDGNDLAAVEAARARWRAYKEAGHPLTYWQQTPQGGWEKKA